MEVFKVFATMSLVDQITAPLKKIERQLKGVEQGSTSLGAKIKTLALGMAPLALAAGGAAMALAGCVSEAMRFEDAMADVAKVVNFETEAELKQMSDTILDMSGRIPMAADGLAAIMAAAAQSGVAKEDLASFAEQAAKMGVAFDLTGDQAGKMMADWRAGMGLTLPQTYALADAVNHLSNNMNATAPALGEVIQRVGPLAMTAGLAEQQVAALGAAFLSAGASPEIAATALKNFTSTLVQGASMSSTAQAAFEGLGFSVTQLAKDMQTDAQGTIFSVLEALAAKPKELQVSILTDMFGKESIGAIAPLLANMGNLEQAFTLVGDSANYAGSMQGEFDARSETTSNAVQLLKNNLSALMITVGNLFTPVISAAAKVLGVVAEALRAVADNPVGGFLLKLAAGVSVAVLAFVAFGAAVAAVGAALPLVIAALSAAAAILAPLAPIILGVVAAAGALYLAFKHNFGGITDLVMGAYNKIKLVIDGVRAVLSSLSGGVGTLRGQLAKDIEANGLLGLVTTIAKAIYRVQEFFRGFWDAISPVLSRVGNMMNGAFGNLFKALSGLPKAFLKLQRAFNPLVRLFETLFGAGVSSAASDCRSLGEVLGWLAGKAVEAFAVGLSQAVNFISLLVDGVSLLAALLTGDFSGALDIAGNMLSTVREMLYNIFNLFGAGDWFNSFADGIKNTAVQIITGLENTWTQIKAWFSGITLVESGRKLISTFIDGIKQAASGLLDTFSGVLSKVREFLPFSDAKRGPLSTLTQSGMALMSTLGEGVVANLGGLLGPLQGVLGAVGEHLSGWFPSLSELFGTDDVPTPSSVPEPRLDEVIPAQPQNRAARAAKEAAGQNITINIARLELPNVQEPQDFIKQLQGLVAEYQGA